MDLGPELVDPREGRVGDEGDGDPSAGDEREGLAALDGDPDRRARDLDGPNVDPDLRGIGRPDPDRIPRNADWIVSNARSKRSRLVAGSTPNPSNSIGMYPLPSPRFNRPATRWSRREDSSASATGSWNGRTLTRTPTRIRRVRCPIAESRTGGLGHRPPEWKWCSATQNVDRPFVSHSLARASSSA